MEGRGRYYMEGPNIVQSMLDRTNHLFKLSPGQGKTFAIKSYIKTCQDNGWRIAIVMPTHDLIEENITKWNESDPHLLFSSLHLGGKEWLGCPDLEMAYLSHCHGCPDHGSCEYTMQMKRLVSDDWDVLFIVPQQLFVLTKCVPEIDVLVVDEELSGIIQSTISLAQEKECEGWPDIRDTKLSFTPLRCDTCEIDTCLDRNVLRKSKNGDTASCSSKMRRVKVMAKIVPETVTEYFLSKKLGSADTMYADSEYIYMSFDFSEMFERVGIIIFNSATTDPKLAKKVFGRNFVVHRDELKVENPIFRVNFSGSIKRMKNLDENFLQKYFKLHGIQKDDCLVACKKEFEKDLESKGYIVGHYGELVGTNKFEHLHDIVLFGRFGWKPHQIDVLTKIFDYPMEMLAKWEEIQTLHRIRLLLDPTKRAFIITSELEHEGFEADHSLSQKTLEMCFGIMDLLPATPKEIRDAYPSSGRKTAIEYMEHIGYLTLRNEIYDRRAK
jgi:hypothetical protein